MLKRLAKRADVVGATVVGPMATDRSQATRSGWSGCWAAAHQRGRTRSRLTATTVMTPGWLRRSLALGGRLRTG